LGKCPLSSPTISWGLNPFKIKHGLAVIGEAQEERRHKKVKVDYYYYNK